MGVTLDLFDSRREYRGTVVEGLSELIHDERKWTVTAEIPARHRARNGEYIGFWCVDGRYRLFEIDGVDEDELTGQATIRATDAAVGDLAGAIVESVMLEEADIREAVNRVMSGLGWRVNVTATTSDTEQVKAYFSPAWTVLSNITDAYNVRITPHYEIVGGKLTSKVLDVADKENKYRGRLVEQGHDASSVVVQYLGSARPMVYGVGAATGTGDPPERVTFANVVWSMANGDPADKPAGQKWIADPQALTRLPVGERRGQTVEFAGITDPEKLLKRTWERAQKAARAQMAATALVSDMEMIAGQEWKALRMWDSVFVKPRSGGGELLQLTSIQRDYVRPWLTKVALGTDEETGMDDLVRKVSQLTKNAMRTSATLGSHGSGIAKNLTYLEDLDIQVDENRTQIGHVFIGLDAANARIDLMATREELTEVDKTLTEVSIALDAAEGEIALKASREYVNEVEGRVTQAEASLTVAFDEIETKVSKDGVISSINQTAESITISASRVNLNGYVTASQLSAELAEIQLSINDSITTRTLNVLGSASADSMYADSCSVGSLRVDGQGISLSSQSVVYDVVTEVSSTGGTVTGVKVTDKKTTIYYLDWE